MSLTTDVRERQSNSLRGNVCVVTGGSRGIGRAIATELGSHGAQVVVNYQHSEGKAHHVADAIREVDGEAVPVQADVADPSDVNEMVDRTREAFGSTDVLVNNAGITADTAFESMTREDWDRVMAVNLGGVFNATQAYFEDIKHADNGRLINISSVVGQQGNYGQANYATTKAGLVGFTRTIALELASSGSTANCVAPGFVETDMLASVPDRIREKILDDIPLDRFATPDDIASFVRFLASEDSAYMTGQILGVNGGLYR